MFRIYSQGMVDKFNYGDCGVYKPLKLSISGELGAELFTGPEKITATANPLMFYGRHLGSKCAAQSLILSTMGTQHQTNTVQNPVGPNSNSIKKTRRTL